MVIELPFSRLDVAFADFLTQRSALATPQQIEFKNIVARLSYQQSQGHTCLSLLSDEQNLIHQSGLAHCVTCSDGLTSASNLPLVLQNETLYTQRYWFYETRLAQQLRQLLLIHTPVADVNSALNHYFAATTEIDWQKEAARMALTHALAIITGGPGTGKTTTVVKILALLLETNPLDKPLHIALAAPTGKAAMRLQESISASKANLNCSETIKQKIPETVSTIHRLLGAKLFSPTFRHNSKQPLPYDVVVIDEASMVDLALMSKLLDALKTDARLILLGDKNQLASVESGSVLADLTQALPHHTVELQKSHRFQGAIKRLADAVNQQQATQAWQLLNQDDTQIGLLETDLIAYIAKQQHAYLSLIQQGADFKTVLAAFSAFQVLCSNREGENGVSDINKRVEKQLNLTGLWYQGRPVMIAQNHPPTQLYNGDIGLCLSDTAQQNQPLMVFFLRPDGSIKKILPSRLPRCETVFAMTIHKSQGSEFDEVLIVLPPTINPVLTKELIYTAITRAKKTVKVVAEQAIFNQALARKVKRLGGLADKLRSP